MLEIELFKASQIEIKKRMFTHENNTRIKNVCSLIKRNVIIARENVAITKQNQYISYMDILFLCSANYQRSNTAEEHFSSRFSQHTITSA